jgi:hypothetical protein
VSSRTLDVGNCDCGATPAHKPVTILNYSTTSAAAFNFTLPGSSWFVATPATGSVPVSVDGVTPGSISVNVAHKAASSTPGVHTETLTVAITGPETRSTPIALRTNVTGARLEYSATSLAFVIQNQSKTFRITNEGNAAANVAFTSSNTAFTVDPTSAYLGTSPLNTSTITVKFAGASGTHQGSVTSTRAVGFPPGGPICNTPPAVSLSANTL